MKSLAGAALLLGLAQAQSLGTARVLEQAGQREKALAEYQAVLRERPRELESYAGFLRLGIELGAYDTVLAVSGRLAGLDPSQFQYSLGTIEALFGLGQRRQALAECSRAAVTWSDEIPMLIQILERHEEYGVAAEFVLQFRRKTGDRLFYAERLVELYERQKRYDEAIREVAGIIRVRPEAVDGLLERLREYARKGHEKLLERELAGVGDAWTRARALASVYLALGKEALAVRVAKQVMSRDGLYGFAHECEDSQAFEAALMIYEEQGLFADKARVLRKQGRKREALEVLSRDESPEALFELAELYRIEEGNPAAALQSYEKLLEKRPGHEGALIGSARARIALGQPEAARAALGRLKKQTDESLLLAGKASLYLGQLDSTRHFGKELCRLFPTSVLVNDGLELALLSHCGERAGELGKALLSFETGKYDAAERTARDLMLGKDAVAEHAHFLVAGILGAKGSAKDGVLLLEEFTELFPESPRRARARFEQAMLFQCLKDDNKTRASLEKLVLEFPGSAYAPIARGLLKETAGIEPGDVR